MQLSWDAIQANAVAFSKRWKDAHNEEAEAQAFQIDFLRVFGVADPVHVGDFEFKVPLAAGKTGYIDYLWKGRIAVEMKSRGKDLNVAFGQLQNYVQHLPESEIPDLWMVCDFATIRLCRRSTNENFTFKVKELRKHIKRFADIAGYTTERVRDGQIEVNVRAAEKMAKLHDALNGHGYEGHSLEVYLVRLLFCLFADDTGIFPQDSLFRYLDASRPDGSDLSERIGKLFEVLNLPEEARARRTLLSDELRQFRYINGGLFKDLLPSAEFDAKMRQILIDCLNFDWNKISPAIFGAMFQGVMDRNQRRELGAHYTSEENILKLINPLFMDELWKEFERVKTDPAALDRFHNKIGRLKFLDPACGCGNFLIITYRELRLLELEVLKMKVGFSQLVLDVTPLLKVGVQQFYGIEYEDFPCQIAAVGMWLMDHQMNLRVSEQFGQYYARLPLAESAHIVRGNALRLDWESVVPKTELSYILGNPPFVGKKEQSPEQKEDMSRIFDRQSGAGNLDYVAAWYKKAASMINGASTKAAFVSTNSISQGEQPSILWKTMLDSIKIDFACRTFKWSNEAKGKAAVHCVIIGFSAKSIPGNKVIFDGDEKIIAENINPYLVNAPDVLIENRAVPVCCAPKIFYGSMPIDNGALILSQEEYVGWLAAEPQAEKFIRGYIGGAELLNNSKRYCLWLKGFAPGEIRSSNFVMKRIAACKEFRERSNRPQTKILAETPHLFGEIRQPETKMLVIPKVSSENRKYIPIAFVTPDIIVNGSALIVPGAVLYHFGVLSSNVHNAWMRAVGGRMKSDYQYSNTLVYNNFPWPEATGEQKQSIEKLAQGVLAARALFPESSLADLYDPLTMPPELLKAHKELDKTVMKLYGFAKDMSEAELVARLMERYQGLVGKEK